MPMLWKKRTRELFQMKRNHRNHRNMTNKGTVSLEDKIARKDNIGRNRKT
jgi:hypothetical protein